jgi:hypothetical protein
MLVMDIGFTTLNSLNVHGNSPLCNTSESSDLDLVTVFLENGSNPNLQCPYPLIVSAAEHGVLDILRALIRYGAIIDEPDYFEFHSNNGSGRNQLGGVCRIPA